MYVTKSTQSKEEKTTNHDVKEERYLSLHETRIFFTRKKHKILVLQFRKRSIYAK